MDTEPESDQPTPDNGATTSTLQDEQPLAPTPTSPSDQREDDDDHEESPKPDGDNNSIDAQRRLHFSMPPTPSTGATQPYSPPQQPDQLLAQAFTLSAQQNNHRDQLTDVVKQHARALQGDLPNTSASRAQRL